MQVPWKNREIERKLSAYLDGELDEREAAELSDRLIFDARFRRQLEACEQVRALADAALIPEDVPNSAAFTDRLMDALAAPVRESQPARPPSRSKLKPVLLASVGILLTAGLTFTGLRRRGLV